MAPPKRHPKNETAYDNRNAAKITGKGIETGLPKNTWQTNQQWAHSEKQSARAIAQREKNHTCHTVLDDFSKAEWLGTDLRVVADHPQDVIDSLRSKHQAIVDHDTTTVILRRRLGFQ